MAIEKYPLHPILTPIDYEERLKILENWTRITSYFNSVEVKIKFLSGGEEIEDILNRINTAVANAQDVTANTQQALDDVNNALSQLNTVISNTNAAAGRADVAADGANQLNVILTTLKGELETLQTDLNGIVQAEAQRVSNESGRVSAEQTRSTDETTRRENEAARMLKEQARENAETQRTTTFNAKMLTADEKIVMMQYLIDNLASYDYNPTATFNFPNLIKSNGSTFIALQEVQGVTPVDDGINYRLVAQRGVDGTGAVSSVNGIAPDTNGNVQVIMELVNNLISDSTTAGLTAAQGKALKVMFDALQQAANNHINDLNNPHQVTAEQVALGNVQNFGIATQAEAETGTAADKYMTPVRTKQAIDANLVTISQSIEQVETNFTTHLDDFESLESQTNSHINLGTGSVNGAHGFKTEEATFTPYLYGATTIGTNTYAVQSGYLVRAGALVTVYGRIKLSAKDAVMAGTIRIGGLPFLSKNHNQGFIPVTLSNYSNLNNLTHMGLTAYINPGTNYIDIIANDAEGISVLIAANITNDTDLMFSATYQIN